MSTGSYHYRQAEKLADQANHYTYGDGADPVTGAALAAEAQVHATLSVAAAIAESKGLDYHTKATGPSPWWRALNEEAK